MSKMNEPKPPARRDEDFPKTTTIPDGWVTDALMEAYNPPPSAAPRKVEPQATTIVTVPATGGVNGKTNGKTNGHTNGHANGNGKHENEPLEDRTVDLFTRRLEPFPSPGDQFGMWL